MVIKNEIVFNFVFKIMIFQSSSEYSHLTKGVVSDWENLVSMNEIPFIVPENIHIPEEFDWRKMGAVTPVKDQKRCGSCYAFSAVSITFFLKTQINIFFYFFDYQIGSLESQLFRLTGNLTTLSEQHLLDCGSRFGNNGCHGGTVEAAFDFIKYNGGISTEEDHPYRGVSDEICYSKSNESLRAGVIGYVKIPQGSEEKLLAAVAAIGPISVAIDASRGSFVFYDSGKRSYRK